MSLQGQADIVCSTKSLVAWTQPVLSGSSVCCTAGWAWGWRREKERFLPKEKEGFLGVRLCIYVLFECKPLIGAAWGFRQYDVCRSYRLCQDNSSASSGWGGTQRSTETPYFVSFSSRVLVTPCLTWAHLPGNVWGALRCPRYQHGVGRYDSWSEAKQDTADSGK